MLTNETQNDDQNGGQNDSQSSGRNGNLDDQNANQNDSHAVDLQLTHLDAQGAAHMVDIAAKAPTFRQAIASGFIAMQPQTLDLIVEGRAAKGDVLAAARIAGIMASKQTAHLIPLCHPLNMTRAAIDLTPMHAGDRPDGRVGIAVQTTCEVTGQTGIEMEALTATAVACLTIYDMCKAVDRGMEIGEIHLLRKSGGKSGTWERPGI